MMTSKIAAIIPAAGVGKRMKADVNKVWLNLNGKSIIEHTLQVFVDSGLFEPIVVVVNEDEVREFKEFLAEKMPEANVLITQGGKERQNSVFNGLQYLSTLSDGEWSSNNTNLVLIHDAARALVSIRLIKEVVEAGKKYQAVSLGIPVKDTIKEVDTEGFVTNTPERTRLWAIQTPQIFNYQLLYQCHQKVIGIERNFSDDCGIIEYCGFPVKIIPGSYENLKITTPEDLIVAEAIMRRNG
ncbi:MAG TPA: 2-C-methyl-D-erythritol 4-phosphate cytidylyltransferase [Bacillota bacterium]|jgi:2-C-methyl-D-erythritol 4-phosphate cytidylyltransferase|nr:2-C-methyl-D-erythritol 4-phosphate cytidylyltransferase [Bacillota bacterium]HOL08715.1 2-C-methyl-D-erythritol 4-phosphate cytidylyltransferase [Bacillota bacterium]HPO96382.1 2-C-methyl-D-erythritol 4-phosphate cytidylyltransferase [Bacillota bacterium]